MRAIARPTPAMAQGVTDRAGLVRCAAAVFARRGAVARTPDEFVGLDIKACERDVSATMTPAAARKASRSTVDAMGASLAARASQVTRFQARSQPAVDLGLRATRADRWCPGYWDALGLAYVSADRQRDAVAAFERAHALAPYDVSV